MKIMALLKEERNRQNCKINSRRRKKEIWGMGIKIGRYHIYLPKMLKPKAVEFRINLWKIFYNIQIKMKFQNLV